MQSRREVQRAQSRGSSRRIIRNLLLIILLVFLLAWSIYAFGNHPRRAADRQALQIARKYANLKNQSAFYIYNREKTYYTVAGKNQSNQNILVIIPQKGGSVRVVKQANGITKNQALSRVWSREKPKKILKVAPGIFNNKTVWEVTYLNRHGKLCYDLLNFKSGHLVQQINNL